jgi:hypothetical protein
MLRCAGIGSPKAGAVPGALLCSVGVDLVTLDSFRKNHRDPCSGAPA